MSVFKKSHKKHRKLVILNNLEIYKSMISKCLNKDFSS